MPAATDVRPGAWSEIEVLYDDGVFSVIWGRYLKRNHRCLGTRWNGGDENPVGFPSSRGYPQWHVEPPFLTVPILEGIILELKRVGSGGGAISHIERVISEAKGQKADGSFWR